MFTIYHSNSPELFIKLMVDTMLCYKLSNPLQSEIILIEHKIMEKWIEIELTNYFGISANVIFMSIQSFIQKIATELFTTKNDIINDVNHIFIYWKFMEVLSKLSSEKKYSIISRYLSFDIHQQKCSQFSEKLVNLFLEYLIYRPDWLDLWESYKIIDRFDVDNQIWQSKVWRMFLKNMQCNSQEFNAAHRCIHFFQKNIQKINWDILPNRIFIYGVTSIPPMYWKILNYLSCYLDIYLWIISPNIKKSNVASCCNQSIINTHNNEKQLCNSSYCITQYYDDNQYDCNNQDCIKFCHPLLHAWSKIGQDTLSLLHQKLNNNICEVKDFILPKSNSVLHILQKSILNFQNNDVSSGKTSCKLFTKKNKKSYLFNSLDQSISIHECYNIQREIEVLHNNILLMLSNDPLLSLGDIVVMSPNIDCYTRTIYAVFNNLFNRKLPFTISSSSNDYLNPIVSSVLDILNISNSRFTSEEILSFLSIPSIAAKFNINDEELKLLRVWIMESGIRWGLDEKTMHNFNVPITDGNTWYFGLRRMLLGYAINDTDSLWENISPYVHINEDHVDVLSKFVEFLEKLRKWRDRFNSLYTLKNWINNFKEIIDDFFDYQVLDSKENHLLFSLNTYWIDIIESGITSGYSRSVNISLLRDKLISKLKKKNVRYRFMPNTINFFNITPICYIPCKILCLIGMNSDNFPRFNNLTYDFNLIVKQPRCGDNQILEKDLYTFLLMCLLPKSKLYFSFIRKSPLNVSVVDSISVLVNELVEYIALNLYISNINSHRISITDNIQNVYKHILHKHSNTPFDSINFIKQSKTPSFAHEWLSSANNYSNLNILTDAKFITMLPKISISKVSLHDLYNFYRHPVRMWFQKRLFVYFYRSNKYKSLINHETFSVDNLYRFILNSRLLDYLVYGKNTDVLYHEIRNSGFLPYGSFGQLYWIDQYEKMNILANQIKILYSPNNTFNLNISLKFKTIELTGSLNSVHKNGLIRWKSANLSMKDCFLMWIEHLIYCAVGGTGDSRLFGTNSTWHFPNFSKLRAKELLFFLISGYCDGMNIPLILLYQCGGIWIDYIFDHNSNTISSEKNIQKKARQKLVQSWQDRAYKCFFDVKENNDPYLRKLIPDYLNNEHIQIITNTARNYFLHIMRCKVL